MKYVDDAFGAIVDVHEAAGLVAVAPNLNFVVAGMARLKNLAADGSGSFLAAAGPGAQRPVNIMETGDAGLHAEILVEVAAHALAEELLPAVSIFGKRGIGVFFPEWDDVLVFLLIAVIDAGGGRIEETLHAGLASGDEHVGIGKDAEHAESFVVFDEAHAAHVGS